MIFRTWSGSIVERPWWFAPRVWLGWLRYYMGH